MTCLLCVNTGQCFKENETVFFQLWCNASFKYSLSTKTMKSDIRVRNWMIREVPEKWPVTSYFFPISMEKGVRPSLSPDLLLPVSICSRSSKTCMINFYQLVISSALWFKKYFIVSLRSIITHQNITQQWCSWATLEKNLLVSVFLVLFLSL